MKKAPKKALSLVTTCAMALSLANPLLIVAAENSSKNASAIVEQAASRATSSKCNLDSLSVDTFKSRLFNNVRHLIYLILEKENISFPKILQYTVYIFF